MEYSTRCLEYRPSMRLSIASHRRLGAQIVGRRPLCALAMAIDAGLRGAALAFLWRLDQRPALLILANQTERRHARSVPAGNIGERLNTGKFWR